MFAGEVDLNTWYKPKIDKKILKELSKRSDIKGHFDISSICDSITFFRLSLLYFMGHVVVYSCIITLW